LQVSLDFVQDVLGGTTKKEGARFGLLALDDEGEVLVADLVDIEEPSLGTDVRLLDFIRAMADGRTAGPKVRREKRRRRKD